MISLSGTRIVLDTSRDVARFTKGGFPMVRGWASQLGAELQRAESQFRHSSRLPWLESLESRTVFSVSPVTRASLLANQVNGVAVEFDAYPALQPDVIPAQPINPIIASGPPILVIVERLPALPIGQLMWTGPSTRSGEAVVALTSPRSAATKGQSADPAASLVFVSDTPSERVQPSLVRSQKPSTERLDQPAPASPESAVVGDENGSDGEARDFVFAAETHSVCREVQEFGFPGADDFRPIDPELVPIEPAIATAPLPLPAFGLLAPDSVESVAFRPEPVQGDRVHEDEPVFAPVDREVSVGFHNRQASSENARDVSWPTWSIAAGLFVVLYRKAIPNWWTGCKSAFGFRFPRRSG
jgi:hypothetical protein